MGLRSITVRPMRQGDIEAVGAMESAHQPRPWSQEVFADELVRDDRIYVVCADEQEVVGFGGVMIVGDEAHVTNLLVAPSHRRQGVARKMMKQLVVQSIDRGARHLTLEVRTRNEAARNLYSSMGLAPVGVRPGYYGDDDALILWAHDIDDDEYLEALS